MLEWQDTVAALAKNTAAVAHGLGGKTGAWYDQPALIAVVGMALHTYMKFRDVRRRPGQEHIGFRAYALDGNRMGATILALTILGLWAINVPIPILPKLLPLLGVDFTVEHIRDILPYHWVTALAIGYMMDSLVKELVKKLPFVGRAFGIKLRPTGAANGSLTISEPMAAVPPPEKTAEKE